MESIRYEIWHIYLSKELKLPRNKYSIDAAIEEFEDIIEQFCHEYFT